MQPQKKKSKTAQNRAVVRLRRLIVFESERCYCRAMINETIVGYARDVPNYEWIDGRWRKVGRSKYKYFVFGSTALNIRQHSCDGFSSLRQAEMALRKCLSVDID